MLNLNNITLIISKPNTIFLNNKELKITSGTSIAYSKAIPHVSPKLYPKLMEILSCIGTIPSVLYLFLSSILKLPPSISLDTILKNSPLLFKEKSKFRIKILEAPANKSPAMSSVYKDKRLDT